MRYLILILALLTGLIQPATAATFPPDIQRIIHNGKLVVALYYKDVPPFFMHDSSGKMTGFDVTIAENMAKQLGVSVEFNRDAKTFDDLVTEIANGKADIAMGLLSRTLPRAQKVDFSQPYLYLPQALLFNRLKAAQLDLKNPALQLNQQGITIGILDQSSYIDYAKESYPNARIVPYDNINQAMEDVEKGKIFAMLLNTLEIENWLSENPDARIYAHVSVLPNKADPIAIATSWENEHLARWISLYLTIIKESGLEAKFRQIYFKQA